MRSKFGTINQSNFGFKDVDRFSSQHRIPPFIGDFFETLTAHIFNAKIISTGAGIKGRRADLQKGKYLIEVKACVDGERFKLTREQHNVFVDVNDKLKEYGGAILYFLYNYSCNWKELKNRRIDDVISILANNVIRLIVCDVDTLSTIVSGGCTKCIYIKNSDFDSFNVCDFPISDRTIYGVYFSSFKGLFVEGEVLDIFDFQQFMKGGRQETLMIDPMTGDCEEAPF